MRDTNFALVLAVTCVLFAGVAAYVPHITSHISRRARMRPPPPVLLHVTRAWFGLLALGCLTLLVLSLLRG